MIDCFNEDEEDEDESVVEEANDEVTSDVEKESATPTVSTEKSKTKATANGNNASPSKTAVVEYIVDQKGVGSESLVVKSAGNKGVALSGMSSANGSRRGSLVSPRRNLLQRHFQNTQTRPTTHTHPLFPNYSRALPHLDAHGHLPGVNSELGLATLNVADFSLNAELWNSASVFPIDFQAASYDPYAAYPTPSLDSIPRYAQIHQVRQHYPPMAMESTQAMNTVMSDLFGDASMF